MYTYLVILPGLSMSEAVSTIYHNNHFDKIGPWQIIMFVSTCLTLWLMVMENRAELAEFLMAAVEGRPDYSD